MTEQTLLIIDMDFQDLVPGYLKRRLSELADIENRLSRNDFTHFKRLGHDWHGTGESYGIPLISRIGEKMTRAAKAGNKKEILALAHQLHTYLSTIEIRYE